MAAKRRLLKEIKDLQDDTPPGVEITPDENNLYKWEGKIWGPEGSPYEQGVFRITIEFPLEYPFKAPTVKFVTPIYHMNITEEGAICMAYTKPDQWKPNTKVDQVLRALVQLLSEPDPDDALVTSIADVYRRDRTAHDKEARDYTAKHALKN